MTFSKVGNAPIVAPISRTAPSQRLRLGAADLARLGIGVARKLGLGASPDAAGGGQFFCFACLDDGLFLGGRGSVGGGGGGGLLLLFVRKGCWVGEAVCDGALEAFEFGLF